jgi:hypothetical protein
VFCEWLRALSVSVRDASVFVFTPGNKLFEATPVLSGRVFMMILYGTPKGEAQESALVGFPSVAIGNLSLPDDGVWRFCLSGAVCSQPTYQTTRGLFILVSDEGPYSIVAEGTSRGFLVPSENENTFMASSNGSFASTAYLVLIPATPPASASTSPSPSLTSSPNPTPTAGPSSTPPLSASPVSTQTWPPIEEPEPEEWKPVRYLLVLVAGAAAIGLMVEVAVDVTRVMKRQAPRRSKN